MPPVAIVLRGPPCGGKSTVAKKLLDCFGDSAAMVVLDQFWTANEKRYLGLCRYWDLLDAHNVLIIELGFGEPAGEPFHGATRNPGEWMSLLRAYGRHVLFFQLWAPWDDIRPRLIKRGVNDPDSARGDHRRYDEGQVCSTREFLARLGPDHSEERIETKAETLVPTCEKIAEQARRILASG